MHIIKHIQLAIERRYSESLCEIARYKKLRSHHAVVHKLHTVVL